MLKQYSNTSLTAGSQRASTCPVGPLDQPGTFREDGSALDPQADTQAKLDAIRYSIENRAQNLGAGLAYALNPDDENDGKPIADNAVAVSSDKPGFLSSLRSSVSNWPIWKYVGLSKPEGKAQVEESVVQFNSNAVSHIFYDCLVQPSEKNINLLNTYVRLFKEELTADFIRDFVLTAIKMRCSKNSSVPEERARYDIASHLIPLFYEKMSDPSRIALFHYALTSNNRDIFDDLVRAHRAQSRPAGFIETLIDKMTNHPELFEMFKDHLYQEAVSEFKQLIQGPVAISLDEDAFTQQITHCFDLLVKSEDPEDAKPMELCMNSARINGYNKRTSI